MSAPDVPPRTAAPFFIVGCVRSGTTLLRDALRLHPHLASPEETHFLRWGDAPGTENFTRAMMNDPVLRRHREMDGIGEAEFQKMLWQSQSRADLYARYMALFIQRRKPGATRWFDKTPQNVYGALLAATTMPQARFIHIVRHPVNVVASLRIGKVIKVENLNGAISYWNEAVSIVQGLYQAFPARVHELRYEDFVQAPAKELERLLRFVDEPFEPAWFSELRTQLVDHSQGGVIGRMGLQAISERCASGMQRYGYLGIPKPETTRWVQRPGSSADSRSTLTDAPERKDA